MPEHSNPFWHQAKPGFYQLKSIGYVGTEAIIEAVNATSYFDNETKRANLDVLSNGWETLREFFAQGGAISRTGRFLTIGLENTNPNLVALIQKEKFLTLQAGELRHMYRMDISKAKLTPKTIVYLLGPNTNKILRQKEMEKGPNLSYVEVNGNRIEIPAEFIDCALVDYLKDLSNRSGINPVVNPNTAVNQIVGELAGKKTIKEYIPRMIELHKEGKFYSDIARELSISRITVSAHIRKLIASGELEPNF